MHGMSEIHRKGARCIKYGRWHVKWGQGASNRAGVHRTGRGMVLVHGRIVGALGGSARVKDGLGTCPQEVGCMPKGRGMLGEVGAARVHRAVGGAL